MTKQEVFELEQKIRKANHAYWNDNKPTISDVEYDELVKQLQKTRPNSELLQHIGGTKGKYRHIKPMLSLDKAYTYQEIKDWLEKTVGATDYISAQPKYDGIAGKIENNRLVTRGDGFLGEDITRHVNSIRVLQFTRDVYHKCSLREFFEISNKDQPIYGELVIDRDTFETKFKTGHIKRADGELYSNQRNAVAGVLNQKDSINIAGLITFVPYNISSMITTRERFTEGWFKTVVSEYDYEFSQYPRDGIVLKVTDKDKYEALGNTAHHPRGAIAFKFGNPIGSGVVASVIWQNGKGRMTPVIELQEPVEISDVLVSRVTAHNYEQFKKFDLHVGDIVTISRAGDVIPKIESVKHVGTESLQIPESCDYCGFPTKIDGKYLCCSNPGCPGGFVSRMEQAAKCLRLDGFGESTCELLYDRLHIKYIWELLQTNYEKGIGYLPGFTDYSAGILYNNVRAIVGAVFDYEVIAALCIPGIGLELARKLMRKYTYEEVFFNEWRDPDILGPTRERWILDAKETMMDHIRKSFEYFKPMRAEINEAKGVICMTGSFDHPKSHYEHYLEHHGYECVNTMSKEVTHLVCDDPDSNSSKIQYARKHNIPIITAKQLMEMVG